MYWSRILKSPAIHHVIIYGSVNSFRFNINSRKEQYTVIDLELEYLRQQSIGKNLKFI